MSSPHATAIAFIDDHDRGNLSRSEGTPGASRASMNCLRGARFVEAETGESAGGAGRSCWKLVRCKPNSRVPDDLLFSVYRNIRSSASPKLFAMRCVRGVMFSGTVTSGRVEMNRSACSICY